MLRSRFVPVLMGIRGAAPAFSPTDIPGLQLWLDFSDTSTLFQDSAMTVPVTTDGDVIGGMMDKSGQGNHLIQSTTALKWVYKTNIQNGLGAALSDGVDDNLWVSPLSINQPITVIDVYRCTADEDYGYLMDSATASNRVIIGHGSALPTPRKLFYYAGALIESAIAEVYPASRVLLTVFNGAGSIMTKNGSAFLSGQSGATAMASIRVGSRYSNTYALNGYHLEKIIYAGIPSAENIDALQQYTNNKWVVY